MKAMVFAAGLGTRLKPFTDFHPKALAEVCGQPMLGIVINRLMKFGVAEIVVNVHHFADQIIDYLRANDDFGITIHISDERSCLLDTGGGILAARQWLDGEEPFIVHNADILTDFDLEEMSRWHNAHDSVATLLVADRNTKRYLLFGREMRMKGWTNIDTGEVRPANLADYECLDKLAFGGVHIVSPAIFPHLHRFASKLDCTSGSQFPKFSIMDFYVSSCCSLPFYGFVPPKPYHWHDIGKPQALRAAEEEFGELYINCI